jgi:hypothetical protein
MSKFIELTHPSEGKYLIHIDSGLRLYGSRSADNRSWWKTSDSLAIQNKESYEEVKAMLIQAPQKGVDKADDLEARAQRIIRALDSFSLGRIEYLEARGIPAYQTREDRVNLVVGLLK